MIGIIRKADIVLAVVLVIICTAASIFVYGSGRSGTSAVVKVNGKIYGEYDLSKNRVIEIDTEWGHNQLIVKNGKIRMSNADCPDRYCVHQFESVGGINASNQTIVCLPHKLVVSIQQKNFKEDEPDAVSGRIESGNSD